MNQRKNVQIHFIFFTDVIQCYADLDPSKELAERSASQLNSEQTQSGFVCIAIISTSRASAFGAHLFARATPNHVATRAPALWR